MLTANEIKTLKFLMFNYDSDYSINQLAKRLNMAPNGALKILKKLEKNNIITKKPIANIISYKINFKDNKTKLILELALIQKIEGKLKYRLEDLKELKNTAEACIIFGSYLNSSKPDDIDILFIVPKEKYKEYRKKITEIKYKIPAKFHEVIQTREDLKNNFIKKDKVILDILKTGIILWGQNIITEVIKDASKDK